MAVRPWVAPSEVKAYSDIEAVASRSDDKLRLDITRAEQYVITYTNNDFSEYTQVPSEVKTAVILLAENYARAAVSPSNTKGLKSESFDDYSYTASDSVSSKNDLDLSALLGAYIKTPPESNFTMRMRKL